MTLAPLQWRSIRQPRQLSVRCLRGRAVVTQQGDAHDLLLVAGETLFVDCAEHLYVQAELECDLRFSSDHSALPGKAVATSAQASGPSRRL